MLHPDIKVPFLEYRVSKNVFYDCLGAKNVRVLMDGFDGLGYVVEDLFAKIRRHEFVRVSS